MIKLLLKQAFKLIFSRKLFAIILMVIIFFSSLTYTFLQSSVDSFQSSYNHLVVDGKLHHSIIKQIFKNNGEYELKVEDGEIEGQKKVVVAKAEGDYKNYFDKNKLDFTIKVENLDQEQQTKKINDEILELKEWIENVVNGQKSVRFQKALKEIYKDKIIVEETNSISVFADVNAFKFVNNANPDRQINKLVVYDGTPKFTRQLTDEQMDTQIKFLAKSKFGDAYYSINKLKGYRWSAQTSIGSTVTLVDPSSYQAIVSPSYANQNNKKSISPSQFLEIYRDYDLEQMHTNDHLKQKYANNLMWVNQMPYFIIGIGVTPDFSFPIVDHSRPIPNFNNEAIVYTNQRGFDRIVDSFRSNPREDYFSVIFNDNLSNQDRQNIEQEIEKIAREGNRGLKTDVEYDDDIPVMAWPKNVQIVTKYDQMDDTIILSQERVVFLRELKNTIHTLTIASTTLLIIFVTTLFVLVFKSLLTIQRKKYATLMALGYSKIKIAIALSCVAFLLVGLPSIFGYLVGHFIQFPFINVFNKYWTIPTYGSMLSWISLFVTVAIPIVMIFFMVLVLSYWDLKNNLVDMLAKREQNKFSLLARYILKHFNWVNVKVKYIISLTIANMGRLVLSTFAGVISVSTIVIGLSSLGTANYAYLKTKQMANYRFQINFYTPTDEGGKYNSMDYKKEAAKSINAHNIYDQDLNKPHWHIPTPRDLYGANITTIDVNNQEQVKAARYFLKNKLQFKPFLDVNLSGINVWDIAKKLMPDNQRNLAEKNEQEFYQKATNVITNQIYVEKPWWPKKENSWQIISKTKMEIKDEDNPNRLDPDFIKFVFNGLEKVSDYKPYIISYNVILLDKDDEKYTYLSFDQKFGNEHLSYEIIGIDPKTKYFNLSENTRQKLQNYQNNKIYPLVINKFISEKLGLGIGNELEIEVNNHFLRNQKDVKPKAKFEIVDIINTYDNNRFLTSKKFTDEIIGFDQGLNDEFNGIFTKNPKPISLNTLSLYSPSDIYFATDTISGKWIEIIEKMLDNEQNHLSPSFSEGEKLKNIKSLSKFFEIYSHTPYVATSQGIIWQDISNESFKNISNLASNIIWIIQIISITLSILFAIIVSGLLISANASKIATLWTLGYHKKEIMKMFTLIYAVPILISMIIGVPIAFGILSALRVFVINFGSILIPFMISWWAVLLATLIMAFIYIFSTGFSIIKIKSDTARKVMGD